MNLDHPAIVTVELTGIACPEMWEGVLIHGSPFRFRYRGGWASLTIADDIEGRATEQVGDWIAGIFEDDEQRNTVFARLYEQAVAANR